MSAKEKKVFKKRLIISITVILSVLLLLYALTLVIPYIQLWMTPEESEVIADYNFYDANYEENIFEDPEYMALIENGALLYDNNANFAATVDKETAADFGGEVKLLVDMVYAIMDGDHTKYNSCFSQKYFETESPKERFTMQKIYNGKLTFFSKEDVTKDGVTYTEYTYKLIYNIYENNGTFRKDIGDGAREQYITVTNREGEPLIDSIQYASYK